MNVILTKKQVKKIPSRYIGLTSGKRCKTTNKRPVVRFCDVEVFTKYLPNENYNILKGKTIIDI